MKSLSKGSRRCVALAFVFALLLASCNSSDDDSHPPLVLNVPSPNWQEQIVYFVLTDRFNDGDPSNDDQHAGEFDPTNNTKYSGGDIRGIDQKIAYIKGLGATSVWLTPPVANQWWDPLVNYGGYHGYWAENFVQVDRHMGSLADYQSMSSDLHTSGMYLIQDIVVNHTGDFFAYVGGWDPNDPARYWTRNTGSVPVTAPSQAPFNEDDPTDPVQRAAAIYHWTPDISDYYDPKQLLNYQLYGLDDLNTENTVVRSALRSSYGYWIKTVGVDAFRIDTAFYVPQAFFSDFMYSTDPQAPGILQVAQSTGRQAFHAFGEGYVTDNAYEDTESKQIETYMSDVSGNDILPAMLNYPLWGTLQDVLISGHPTGELAYRIQDMMQVFKRPYLMPTFLDNHDVGRFLATGTMAGLQQGLVLIMTLPGIPVIYYGTEQGFTEARGSMFAAGFRSGGTDHFNTAAPLYGFIAQLAALRTQNKVFTHGAPTILQQNMSTPGILAYKMSYTGSTAIMVINTSDTVTMSANFATGLAPATVLKSKFAVGAAGSDLVVTADGSVTLPLLPRSAYIWLAGPGS
ncbi:alpha-amylase family glycosyl hydrolase [Caballeronia mineralivorans]|jgi:glycosidase|uniref:alpha-amylase family glycosyl hydrolase n=1 Tax=Caballeronia mineralivorans TaxID=2010198 RepID=UPI0023F39B1B|nr:alpha-amylase family glycosyl hydrolase [Caballeronia mineralivorans]MDB5788671.1 alpha amylase catalytic region [Caballeronia mineralivorans]MEA3102146.1 hypothetical protein [Caballeronia mineralivorans]